MAFRRFHPTYALALVPAVLGMTAAADAKPIPKSPKLITTTERDASFWNDWHDRSQSADFKQLERDAGAGSATQDAVAQGRAANRQPIANIAVNSIESARRLLEAAAKSQSDRESREALQAIAMLRTTAETRADAIRQMDPGSKAAATEFVNHVSNGIPGLPGIYLDNAPLQRSPEPAGYAPVAGRSLGCPSHD